MRFRLRKADVQDVEALRRLFDGAPGDGCLRLATSGDALVAVSGAGGEVIGVAGIGPTAGEQPVEVAVFVAPAWRGAGVGRTLSDAAHELAAERRLRTRPRPTVLGDAA